MRKTFFLTLLFCAATIVSFSQDAVIHINQLGFYPYQEKVAVVEGKVKLLKKYKVTNSAGHVVLKGFVAKCDVAKSCFSDEKAYRIDMSSIIRPGKYTLYVDKTSAEFVVNNNVLDDLSKAGMKAYYYQRCGMPIEEKYAGKWKRPAAHKDTEVLVHPSAATASRPAGTVISSPKGWYDAGDYNKYIVNSSFAIGQILNMYPFVEEYFKSQKLNIPESDNDVPDVLDEIHYNLEWMLTMQDTDGGLYHKLTTPDFENFIKPTECKQTRYVVQKSTCATLDFAATMAMAARIYAPYEATYPGFSAKALLAAKKAYLWALKNPEVYYNQKEINKKFSPAINTGTYGDFNAKDEFFWATVELYLTTKNESFLKEAETYKPMKFAAPSWGNVASLGLTSWIMNYTVGKQPRTPDTVGMEEYAQDLLVEWADAYIKKAEASMFFAPFGNNASDFHWASMADGAATGAISLIHAYIATKDKKYLINARRNTDYLLGRNPLNYCYVTGFGTKSPKHPHHRISATDNVEEPVPGLLVGGPNATANEGDFYHSKQPDKRYADVQGSYTTNEIAINWNSALVALTAALQTVQDY